MQTVALRKYLRKFWTTTTRVNFFIVQKSAFVPTEDNFVFGEELSMDLMFLDCKEVLYIVDTATHLSSATFVDENGTNYGQSVQGVWIAFVMNWCTMYIGYQNLLSTDQGSILNSERWTKWWICMEFCSDFWISCSQLIRYWWAISRTNWKNLSKNAI